MMPQGVLDQTGVGRGFNSLQRLWPPEGGPLEFIRYDETFGVTQRIAPKVSGSIPSSGSGPQKGGRWNSAVMMKLLAGATCEVH